MLLSILLWVPCVASTPVIPSITHLPVSSLPTPDPATFHPDLAPPVNASAVVPSRACGADPPTDFILHAHHEAHAAVSNASHPQNLHARSISPRYTVQTFFHVVSTRDQRNAVTKGMVSNQLAALRAAYQSSGLFFTLAGVDFSVNDSWATGAADSAMKKSLRRGNYSSLNIYYQTNLSTSGKSGSSQLLGICTLPTNVTYSPCDGCAPAEFSAADYVLDGCNVLAGSMPGGHTAGYDLGRTAVHEVGHWFGLLHTFQGMSCAASNSGDQISDTPQQSTATSGCPAGKDSCPGIPGLDPIHNFMDYSTDRCYVNFTAQQMTRMTTMYAQLRYTY